MLAPNNLAWGEFVNEFTRWVRDEFVNRFTSSFRAMRPSRGRGVIFVAIAAGQSGGNGGLKIETKDASM